MTNSSSLSSSMNTNQDNENMILYIFSQISKSKLKIIYKPFPKTNYGHCYTLKTIEIWHLFQ